MKEEEEGGVHEEFKRTCDKGRVLIMGDFNLSGIYLVEEQGKSRRGFPSFSPGLLFNPVCR